jgi:hypothetical protein
MIYDLNNLIKGLGGIEETKDALDWFRKETVKAGFEGLDLQLALWGKGVGIEMVENLNFDGITHYQFVHFTNIDRNYLEILKDVAKKWEAIDKDYKIPYYPHISVGWDNNPRFEMFREGIVKNNTPENFEKALQMAREYVDNHPKQTPLITINSWNEWTETSYLMPCTMYGYSYLEAVKKVFGDTNNRF